jgi:hypothetical protein
MPVVGASPVWLSQGIRSLSNTDSEDKNESGMLESKAAALRRQMKKSVQSSKSEKGKTLTLGQRLQAVISDVISSPG